MLASRTFTLPSFLSSATSHPSARIAVAHEIKMEPMAIAKNIMANPQDPLRSQTMKFTLASKNVLTLEEAELYELSELAGVIIDQKVFKIILDLLKMNVSPSAIVQMLKHMRSHGKAPPVTKDTQSKPRHVKQQQKSETGTTLSARSEINSRVRGHSAPRTGNYSAR